MTDDEYDAVLAGVRAEIETRVQEQLERHHRISPNMDPRQVVDIQIRQESERLERFIDKLEDEGKDSQAKVIQVLKDEWLPELAQTLKRR